MRSFLPIVLRLGVLFPIGLVILHCGQARVLTEIQSGPLYRVLDHSLSITCNVSGFLNHDASKVFEFSMHRLPDKEINIISTSNPDFSFSGHMRRVEAKEITLEHMGPNSVIFTIKNLKATDDGKYTCSVENIDLTYNGAYSAQTTVKVIDDSLTVSSPDSLPRSHTEGDSLTLTCQVSSNTVQHTHLSVAWYLHAVGEDSAGPIISLDQDMTLRPGVGFEGRYQAGLIRLDKMGEATYRLKMDQLKVSDQGRIYCRAQEWIQDPDRTWYSITQKDTEPTPLNVKAEEVLPDRSYIVVTITVQKTSLQEGQELSIACNVDVQNLSERFFSVAWLRDGVELARLGPTGILRVGPEYNDRKIGGELRATRTSDKENQLILRPVRTQDQGEYMCRAWPQDRGSKGKFTEGTPQDSSTQAVSISATESGLTVEMETKNVAVNEGGKLQLTCKVSGVSGQLSVTWEYKSGSISTDSFRNVIALNREGITESGPGFAQRDVRASRPADGVFTLELNEVTPSDAGIYQCTVSEWARKANTNIDKTHSQSQLSTVAVNLAESSLKLDLKSRQSVVTVGEEAALRCRVRGSVGSVPMTVRWSLQSEDSSSLDNILTVSHSGDITWQEGRHRYQVKIESFGTEVHHTLLIVGASKREAGRYQCEVSVFLEKRHKKLPPSNLLAVVVKDPETALSLTSAPTITGGVNADIKIKCTAKERTSASSRFAVTWVVQPEAGDNKTILSISHDGVVTFEPQVESSTGQRISGMQKEGRSFELTIRQALVRDSGTYICMVVEWLQDPDGQWFQLTPAHTTTELRIIEPANDLHLDKTEHQLIATEGGDVELNCTLTSVGFNPSFVYAIVWFYTGSDLSAQKVPLAEVDHIGLMRWPESQPLQGLQGRLRLSRPTRSTFNLHIQRAHEGDSGTYQCRVEQYQLDHRGHWQQRATDESGLISLTVKAIERNLSIGKEDIQLNLTASNEFVIPCTITAQSSKSSAFHITWFRQQNTGSEQHPIFTVYQNSTLQDRSGRGGRLRYDHPVPSHFHLTMLNATPDDSGLYFCRAEEWILSPSLKWKKVAVETSGEFTVNVHAEAVATALESGCSLGIFLGISSVVIVCLMVVVSILVFRIYQSKFSAAKKPDSTLWAEGIPLESKSCLED